MYKTTIQHNLDKIDVTTINIPTHEISNYSFSCHCSEDKYVINLKKGNMYCTSSHLNIDLENDFLDKMCECIISKHAGHNIELFKAGQSEMLKERILKFLEETN